MKIYGSKFYACQEEYEETGYGELAEITVVCDIDELEKLTDFLKEELVAMTNYLNKVKNEPESVAGETVYSHSHYRLWDKQWKNGAPDFIIATKIII